MNDDNSMKDNIVKNKSFEFAIEIIKLYKFLCEQKKEFVMSKQLLRSGTLIGANVRESEYAESRLDFIHKMSIALKEANESEYWLELLVQSNYLDKKLQQKINLQLTEILKLLTAIIKSSKYYKQK